MRLVSSSLIKAHCERFISSNLSASLSPVHSFEASRVKPLRVIFVIAFRKCKLVRLLRIYLSREGSFFFRAMILNVGRITFKVSLVIPLLLHALDLYSSEHVIHQ